MVRTSKEDLELMKQLGEDAQAAYFIWAVSHFDRRLQWILIDRMRILTKALTDKIFDSRGPLSGLSAKIDIAYAFDVIPKDLHKDLHTFRVVRNEFAHSAEHLNLSSPEIEVLLRKFDDFDPERDRMSYFVRKLRETNSRLNDIKPKMGPLARALSNAIPPT